MSAVVVEFCFCRDCGEAKPVEDFYVYKTTGKAYPRCKPCHYMRTQAWRANNGDKIRELERTRYAGRYRGKKIAYHRLRKYGITQEEYDSLLEVQGGQCPICLRPFEESRGNAGSWEIASVDHDHKTGEVRGILHRRCNLALELGLTEDDWRRASAYLARRATDT